MPIYEYYCPDCHMMLNFYARAITPSKKPSCPHCGRRKLQREVSMFATIHHDDAASDEIARDTLPVDDHKMESAMAALASEAEHMDENDPKAAAQMMRRFSEMTGLPLNDSMQEALHRMEEGADPEAVEAELGDLMETEDPFVLAGNHARRSTDVRKKPRRLRHDPTLYDL